MAAALMTALDSFRPNMPLIRNPARGRAGMSQSWCIGCLQLQRGDFVDLEGSPVLEDRQDDGQADGRFGRGDHHHEES